MKTSSWIATSLFVVVGCTRSTPPGVVADPDVHGPTAAWNGGKQGPPFTVTSSVQDVVATNVDLTIPLTITPGRNCTKLTTVPRGIDGVAVRAAGTPTAFTTCALGAALSQSVVVRVPAGVAGYLILDVKAEVDGRMVAGSYSIPLRAQGAEFVRHTTGEVEIGPNGERVITMPATER